MRSRFANKTFMQKVAYLPDDVIYYIKDFIPNHILLWVSKKIYIKYRNLIKFMYNTNDSYVRNVLRTDNSFVFDFVLRDNFIKWWNCKKYQYKNRIYPTFLDFLIYYCVLNESTNCKNMITDAITLFERIP
jgi:hypothetical protein